MMKLPIAAAFALALLAPAFAQEAAPSEPSPEGQAATAPLELRFAWAMGYGPREGTPLVSLPRLELSLWLDGFLGVYVYENLFNTMATVVTLGAGLALDFEYVGADLGFSWGTMEQGAVVYSTIDASLALGLPIRYRDAYVCKVYAKGGPSFALYANDLAAFSRAYSSASGVYWNLEFGCEFKLDWLSPG